nr:NAD(P)-dependent oxidoreductase [Cellulomonas sp. APG4]
MLARLARTNCRRNRLQWSRMMTDESTPRIGWIGAGRMGAAMAARLLAAGYDVAVYNRTRAKAEALEPLGASVVDSPVELADRDVVHTMVSTAADLRAVLTGPGGLLTGDVVPPVVVDSTTADVTQGDELRALAAERGVRLLAAPVSGNAKVIDAGRLTMVTSGPREVHDAVLPQLEAIARAVTYVGDGERARLVKICHNLFLGVVTQSMAEITVLAEKGGIARHDFLAFLNDSVMGSTFTRYKTPAFVNLDLTPTFTAVLLRKDFDLGLAAGRRLDAPMPVAALVHQLVGAAVAEGRTTEDFAVLLELQARAAGLELVPEDAQVTEGLVPAQEG